MCGCKAYYVITYSPEGPTKLSVIGKEVYQVRVFCGLFVGSCNNPRTLGIEVGRQRVVGMCGDKILPILTSV